MAELRARLGLALFVATLGLGAANRSVVERRLPDGLLVEVAGDVRHPGVHLVATPTVGEAIEAAGGSGSDATALVGGSRVVVRGDARVEPSGDPVLLGHVVDVNVQGATVLESLPGVGPSTAGAILDHRARYGPFRAVDELSWVRGVGPATLDRIRPFVGTGDVPPRDPPGPIDLNAAPPALLERLPGIGPTRAAAIVADREAHGPFSSVADLDRVPGIGPATVERLGGGVVAR